MFTTDNRTENFLNRLGVKWDYINGIKFPEAFAKNWNTVNLGRPVAVRDEAVYEYAELMNQGSPAPAPILYETDEGYMVGDGVQRLSATLLRDTTRVSAYVVNTDDENSLAMIRVLANPTIQGRAEAIEWTKKRAVEELVVIRKMSPPEVSSICGWKPAEIIRIADAIRVQQRISSAGGPMLPDVMLCALKTHIDTEGTSIIDNAAVPVVGFLNTLKQSKISVADAEDYIKEFFAPLPQSASPYKEYVGRLQHVQEDPEMKARLTGRQRSELADDVLLLRHLRAAENKLSDILTSGERLVNVDQYYRIMNKITGMLGDAAAKKQKVKAPAVMRRKSK